MLIFRLLIVRVKGIFYEKNVRLFNIDNFHIRLFHLFGADCNKDVYFAIGWYYCLSAIVSQSTEIHFDIWNPLSCHFDCFPLHSPYFSEKASIIKGAVKLEFSGLTVSLASLLVAHREDMARISRRLGHSRTSTTMDIYAHAYAEKDAELSGIMSQILYKKEP